MLKNRIISCRPTTKNYERGFASLSRKERLALYKGSILEVRVIDRNGSPDIILNPSLVLKHTHVHTYSRQYSVYRFNILRFNFLKVEKLQSRFESQKIEL